LIDSAEVDPPELLLVLAFLHLYLSKKKKSVESKKKDKILKYYYDVFSVFLDFELRKEEFGKRRKCWLIRIS